MRIEQMYLTNFAMDNVDSTLFSVVNSNVGIHSVVLTLI